VYHQILKIVDTLPERMQQIVKLKFLHNYKYTEIAEELGISVNTVKTQLKRAKVKIIEMVTSLLILLQTQQ
jgi:RNA polymerase sigma-70 factor (ECF subfamily)